MFRTLALLGGAFVLASTSSCAPKLAAPGESIRVTGTVTSATELTPVQVQIFEQCSPWLYFFEKCPGRFLGEAKIPKPGPFLVEIDTEASNVWMFAFRGVPGSEVECGSAIVATADAKTGRAIATEPGACPVDLPTKQYIP